jgi:hypothetical protein
LDSAGITVAETLTVHPPPLLLQRAATISFDPDTLVIALLQTPEGLHRFTAALNQPGSQVRVVDAAMLAPKRHGPLRTTIKVATLAACLVTGYAAAEDQLTPTLVAGGICATGGVGLSLGWF